MTTTNESPRSAERVNDAAERLLEGLRAIEATSTDYSSRRLAETMLVVFPAALAAERRATVERIEEAMRAAWYGRGLGYVSAQARDDLGLILDAEAER